MIASLLKPLLRRSRRGIIFAAHGVATTIVNRRVEEVHLGLSQIQEIVSVLRELDFDFLSMEQVVELVRSGSRHPKHWAHFSFDDGYQNLFDVGYPFLRQSRIPFSVFVSTHHVQTGERFPTFWLRLAEEVGVPLRDLFPEYRLGASPAQELFDRGLKFAPYANHVRIVEIVKQAVLDQEGEGTLSRYYNDMPIRLDDLKTMSADPLVHIGSHSHHHIIFHDQQDPQLAEENLRTSQHLIRDEWRLTAEPTFCFPNGDWAPQWANMVSEMGFPLAFPQATGFIDRNPDPMVMPRFWMLDGKRTRIVAALSALGNWSMRLAGRKPPPTRTAAPQ